MTEEPQSMARQVADAAAVYQFNSTGHLPKTVTVVFSKDTLVITLHDALTPAEQAMSSTPEGAARVQEYHQQLFASSSDVLKKQIKQITGVEVREATAQVEPRSGSIVHAFTSGTMIQVFLMASNLTHQSWEGL